MHRTLFWFCFATVAACSANAADSLKLYENSRFMYRVEHPANLIPQGEAGNGDGQVFRSKNADASLTVFGQYVVDGNAEQCDVIARSHQQGFNVTYKVQKAKLTVASGFVKPGTVFYSKGVVAGDVCLILELEYPVSQKDQYDAMVTRISNSLQRVR